MIQCSNCQNWTHYLCSKLPAYQLFTLINSTRRYTCENCAKVPTDFKEKWDPINTHSEPKNTQSVAVYDNYEKTLAIVRRIEQSLVSTITSTHKNNQDDKISSLQDQLEKQLLDDIV